jgi:hypothetical protein
MNQRISSSVMAVAFAIGVATTQPASAQSSVVWQYDAMACVPAGAPIATDLHDSLAGGVRFKAGKTGNIALICPISHNVGTGGLRSLRLTYRDGDGNLGPSVVTAVIPRVRRSDGHVATLLNGDVNSNDSNAPNSGPTGWATHQSGSPGHVLSHLPDLLNYYYYVQINMKRTDAAVPLAVMGVHLTN